MQNQTHTLFDGGQINYSKISNFEVHVIVVAVLSLMYVLSFARE